MARHGTCATVAPYYSLVTAFRRAHTLLGCIAGSPPSKTPDSLPKQSGYFDSSDRVKVEFLGANGLDLAVVPLLPSFFQAKMAPSADRTMRQVRRQTTLSLDRAVSSVLFAPGDITAPVLVVITRDLRATAVQPCPSAQTIRVLGRYCNPICERFGATLAFSGHTAASARGTGHMACQHMHIPFACMAHLQLRHSVKHIFICAQTADWQTNG